MCKISLLVFCMCAALANAQELKLPAEANAAPGELVEIVAKGDVLGVTWYCPDAGVSLVPRGKLKDPLSTIAVAVKPGKYRLVAVGYGESGATDPVTVVLVVAGSGPVEPLPPDDPLRKVMQELYTADSGKDKAEHIGKLAALYKLAVKECDDSDNKTAGDLLKTIRVAGEKMLPASALPEIRKRLATELRAALPTDMDAALTPETRAAAAKIFGRLATVLEGIK